MDQFFREMLYIVVTFHVTSRLVKIFTGEKLRLFPSESKPFNADGDENQSSSN